MENRKDQRLPITLPVCIHNPTSLIGNFIVKDISPGGVNIHDPDQLLSMADVVYLDFGRSNRRASTQPSEIKAVVLYRFEHSVGLKWLDDHDASQKLLQNVSKNHVA